MSNQKQVFKVGQKPTSWKKVVPDHKQRKSFPSPVEVPEGKTDTMRREADSARERVSEYTNEQKAALEREARASVQQSQEKVYEHKARPITRRSKLTTKRIDAQDTTPVAGLGCMLTYYRGKAMINAYIWHKLYTYRPNRFDVILAILISTIIAYLKWAN